MTITSASLRKLASLNLSAEQMAGVLDLLADVQQKEEDRLAAQRERKRQNREMSRDSHGTVTGQDCDKKQKEKRTKKEKIKIYIPPYIPPTDVSQEVWADFTALRQRKRAEITQTAIDGIRREAEKAGWAFEDALRECCSRGWVGFKADWVGDKRGNIGTSNGKSKRDRAREALARAHLATVGGQEITADGGNSEPMLRCLENLRQGA